MKKQATAKGGATISALKMLLLAALTAGIIAMVQTLETHPALKSLWWAVPVATILKFAWKYLEITKGGCKT